MTSSTRREAPFSTSLILEPVGCNTGVYVLAHVVMRHYVTGVMADVRREASPLGVMRHYGSGVMAAGVSGHYGFCAGYRVLRVVGGSALAP